MLRPSDVPALLTMPHYRGTLAAVRCLGAYQVPVWIAADRLAAPAAWSRHVDQRSTIPAIDDGPEAIRDSLIKLGRSRPGAVLYPTSDDMAWVISRFADDLRPYFHLYAPSAFALASLMDKAQLYANCVVLGIPTPRTYLPEDEADAKGYLDAHGPLLVKPRSQAFFIHGAKGEMCARPEEGVRCWLRHRDLHYAQGMDAHIPNIGLPLLQEFVPRAGDHTYSVSGFIDARGQVHGVRSSLKLVQSPPIVGVGVSFVSAPIEQSALENIVRLCEHVGYFGVFEVEFVRRGDEALLIDFNPRYYGQMGFDVARGVPHSWLVQLAALGREDEIPTALAAAAFGGSPERYHDAVALRWNALCDYAAGELGADDLQEIWRAIPASGSARDSLIDDDDMLPAWIGGLSTIFGTLKQRALWRRVLRPRQVAVSASR